MTKKTKFRTYLLLTFLAVAPAARPADGQTIREGRWQIVFHPETRTVDYIHDNETVLAGVFVKTKSEKTFYRSTDYPEVSFSDEQINDAFGEGKKYIITYSGLSRKPDIEQVFYFYSDKDYFLTEARMTSTVIRSSNYLAPVVTETRSPFLANEEENRVLSVPFDNDAWICYYTYPFEKDTISFEVTALYSSKSRKGLVIGSVEHDCWKSAVRYSVRENRYIDKLECFAGVSHSLTRDKKEHGSLSGKTVGSPRMLVGVFDDWRLGMETYADANARITPPRHWTGGNIFGWNSWGALADKVNFQAVTEISDYISDRLQPAGFHNGDGTAYMILDSYWDNLSSYQIGQFVKQCRSNNQVPGIYWAPFTYWGEDDNEFVIDGMDYRYKDIYLYVNGKVCTLSNNNKALDPTHPATQARIKQQIEQYKRWGFEYLKLDYLVNASVQADSYYDKNVTTGIQAYNSGMAFLSETCGDDMFLALSISPLFPSQYGNSRRISCDAWGKLADSKYVLNGLSGGWWLDRVYPFNDPDHLTFYKDKNGTQSSEKEARIRATSGAITGTYIIGDNLSLSGTKPGEQAARDRTEKIATNAGINEIAQIGRSFRPVEGNGIFEKRGNDPEKFFMLDTPGCLYLAVFNYQAEKMTGTMNLPRLGITPDEITAIKELWSGNEVTLSGDNLPYELPGSDVKVFRMEKTGTGIETIESEKDRKTVFIRVDRSLLTIRSEIPLTGIDLYSSDGILRKKIPVDRRTYVETDISELPGGLYIVQATNTRQQSNRTKIIK